MVTVQDCRLKLHKNASLQMLSPATQLNLGGDEGKGGERKEGNGKEVRTLDARNVSRQSFRKNRRRWPHNHNHPLLPFPASRPFSFPLPFSLNSTQRASTDVGVNTSMSASV